MRKASPTKKIDYLDICHRMQYAVEFFSKNLDEDCLILQAHFSLLDKNISILEEAIHQKKSPTAFDAHKLLNESNHILQKASKLQETAQKKCNKLLAYIDKKLLQPFEKDNHNADPKQEIIKVDIAKIQAAINQQKERLGTLGSQWQRFALLFANLEPSAHQLNLGDDVNDTIKMHDKLNAKIEQICKQTAQFQIMDNPERHEADKIEQSMLHLYQAHQRGTTLLLQLQSQLKLKPLPYSDASASSSVAQIEGAGH